MGSGEVIVEWKETNWSPACKMRKELMKTLDPLPTISCAKDELGSNLAEIVFCTCHPELKPDFGLEPPLDGPGDTLWVSPSDLLIGNVCLKPPLTQKHIQALTHQGILEIGREIEVKYWNEMEAEKQKALAEKEALLTRMFELQKNQLIARLREEERDKFFREMKALQDYYDNQFTLLIQILGDQMQNLAEEHATALKELDEEWQEKLEAEVEKTIKKMNEEFLFKIAEQEEILVEIFTKQIGDINAKKMCALEFERAKCREALAQLKHKLECRNVANLMYLLCKERRKCKEEKQSIETKYKERIHSKNRIIRTKDKVIKTLEAEKRYKTHQVQIREKCLVEILRQYQKMINFALRAAPTQAEFLLSVHRILKYEVDAYCLEKERQKAICLDEKATVEEEQVVEQDTLKYLLVGAENYDEEFEGSHVENDDLPAFYFNKSMYVREDFRDLLSSTSRLNKITKDHPLWNPDVEELLKIFRQSLEDKEKESQQKPTSSSHPSLNEQPSQEVAAEYLDSEPPNYQCECGFKPPEETAEEEKILSTTSPVQGSGTIMKQEKRAKPSTSLNVILKPSETSKEPRGLALTPSKLVLARDSIILKISELERRSLVTAAAAHLQHDDTVPSPEVRSMKKTPSIRSTPSLKNYETEEEYTESVRYPVNTTSKLVLACDSLEIVKSRMSLVHGASHDAGGEKDNMRQSFLTFGTTTTQIDETSSEDGKTRTTLHSWKFASPSSGKKSYKSVVSNKSKKTKRTGPSAKIVGDRKALECDEGSEEFTDKRIKSLVALIRNEPSLIGLFTACSK